MSPFLSLQRPFSVTASSLLCPYNATFQTNIKVFFLNLHRRGIPEQGRKRATRGPKDAVLASASLWHARPLKRVGVL